MRQDVAKAYDTIGNELGVKIAPVGLELHAASSSRALHPLRRERRLPQANADRIEDGIGNRRAGGNGRGFTAAHGRHV